MTGSHFTDGLFLTGTEWQAMRCTHTDVVHILDPAEPADSWPRFIPAPVDLHVHGAGGYDVMHGEQALRAVLRTQARQGCGALLATSVAAPLQVIDDFLASVQTVMNTPDEGSAALLGAHLEGPFINPDKLGAQPPHACALDTAVLERWLKTGVVRVITFAPEMDVESIVPRMCARYGVRAQIGHTLCSGWQAHAALELGCGVTHLWNAMSGATHREGGAAVAAFAEAEYAEIIPDGIHVDELAFRAAWRAIPKLYAVTDGTAAVGMPDGAYWLGSHEVQKRGHRVELSDGTLAGSCLDQIRLCTVLRDWQLSWPEVSRMHSGFPAAWIDEPTLGSIHVGMRAHWLELDQERPCALWLDGQRQAL